MHMFGNMDLYEAIMLICFGASWPFALVKTYKTKNVKGKSKVFLSLIIVGYIFGMLHKYFYSPDAVIYLYLLNLLLVSVDMYFVLAYRNRPENA